MNRFSIAGLLAAGAMLFATLGCDTAVSEKEWADETPTTYAELDGTNSSDVTAVWDFSTLSATSAGQWDGVISTSDSKIEEGTEIKPSSGSKATLYAGTFKGKTNAGVLQVSKGSASLSDLSNAYSLVLNLEADSDVVIKAKGAGPAEAARLIAIYAADFDEDKKTATATGNPLVYKDNLASTKDVLFQLKDAPAGAYMIYINGSSIAKIDTTATTLKPAQIKALKITTAQSDIASFEAYETLTLDVVDSGAASSSLAKDAVWTTSNESVATVKEGVVTGVAAGTAVIRARIGRFYDERTVTVTKSTKTIITLVSGDSLPKSAKWIVSSSADNVDTTTTVEDFLSADELTPLLKPSVIGGFAEAVGDATLTFNDNFDILRTKDGKAGYLPKGETGSTDGNFGLYWRAASYTPAASDTNKIDEATFSFKVKPTGSSAKLSKLTALTGTNKGSSTHLLKVTVGSVEKTGGFNKPAAITEIDLGDITITGETEVKVTVVAATDKTRTGLQDIKLFIVE